ncbi:MAG: hypothetical protein K8S99_18660 [Planctomycetes bacterium]|nr:hypothetical protein [Planctomycetota bacterium]
MHSPFQTTRPANTQRLHACLAPLVLALVAASAYAGSISGTIAGDAKVTKVWAVLRDPTKTGVLAKPVVGRIEGDHFVIDGLEIGGPYDLRIQTDHGTLEGWDAAVPAPSDPENPVPMDEESLRAILAKMAGNNVSGFDDRVIVLDVQGHGEHAAVLSTRLRTRPFTESKGVNATTWIWRVDRWQWELAEGLTWVPWQERPFYALRRERLREAEYKAVRVVYGRHLGGLRLTADHPDISLGTITLPVFEPGVHAINPDGTPTHPIQIKPGGVPHKQPAPTTRPAAETQP